MAIAILRCLLLESTIELSVAPLSDVLMLPWLMFTFESYWIENSPAMKPFKLNLMMVSFWFSR
jgi:hypothetical protein